MYGTIDAMDASTAGGVNSSAPMSGVVELRVSPSKSVVTPVIGVAAPFKAEE